MSKLHPILKPHLQGQKVVARKHPAFGTKEERLRWSVLAHVTAQLEEAGVNIDRGQLEWAVTEVNRQLYEASLDRQYEDEMEKALSALRELELGRDAQFEKEQEEKEAEREERRQYREWRNDSGV